MEHRSPFKKAPQGLRTLLLAGTAAASATAASAEPIQPFWLMPTTVATSLGIEKAAASEQVKTFKSRVFATQTVNLLNLDTADEGDRQWGTYYGGAGYEEGQSVSTDGSGNVYIAGLTSTFMGSGIATPGSYQASNGGGNDAFLAKFDAAGVRQWGTYYGGVGGDAGLSCVAEATNYVYLSGRTNTSAAGVIASTGSHQAAAGGNDDAFLVKLCNVPNAPTNLTPAANQTLCAGGTTTLTFSGTGSLSWFANPTGGAAIATGATYVRVSAGPTHWSLLASRRAHSISSRCRGFRKMMAASPALMLPTSCWEVEGGMFAISEDQERIDAKVAVSAMPAKGATPVHHAR